ncbi:DUF6686 family protein [Seonamhaeicola marinus]|uniref:Uncharacterized protein n=1 Tax=Seonamhaeicola marinus TaxID=1912246 RepID=A0A5D0HMB2_9FLAO|nr:DUF6686 family protein [Seonamhaeicola marinus]TYA71469.1 hypothetical protein FUA24_17970 [Seonamhaeicola marinus]
MCHKYITLAKNCDGQLTYCSSYGVYHLTFNNIYLEFTEKDIIRFKEYIIELEADYWQIPYDRVVMNRKIPIRTLQQNLSLIFSKQELNSLKSLVMQSTKRPFEDLSVFEIDYLFYLN